MISFLTKHPDFFIIDKTKSNKNPIKVIYSKEICDVSKYEIRKDSKSIHNWTYEFDLFCNRDYYNTLIVYSVLFGQFLGTLLLSPFPDKYGRKIIFKIIIVISFLKYSIII